MIKKTSVELGYQQADSET